MTARVPTIPTTSSRTSTAASCARCVSSARGRTSPISRRRIRSTRSSPRTAARSSNTTCRTSARRSACATIYHEWDLSWEHFYQGDTTRRRLFSFGFALSPWQTVDYVEYPSIGKFEGDRFDPRTWRPQTPTTAYLELRDDDAFWAARRVAAFTDDLIRAAVHTGQYSDPDGGEIPGRRADQAPRQDHQHLSDRGEPHRRPASRCERPVDVRKRGGRGRRGERPGHLPRLLVSLRQRDGRDASPFGNAEPDDNHRGAARPADGVWQFRRGGHLRRQRRHTRRGGGRSAPISAERATAGRSWGSNGCPRASQPVQQRKIRRADRGRRHDRMPNEAVAPAATLSPSSISGRTPAA